MYLIYVDEYGTSGGSLDNPREPYFSLTATLINEKNWVSVESDILKLQQEAIEHFVRLGLPLNGRFEFHAAEMMQGKKAFQGFPIELQLDFAERLIAIPSKHQVKFITISTEKVKLHSMLLAIEKVTENWPEKNKLDMLAAYKKRFSPYSICFCMLLAVLNLWLVGQVERGMLIFDENDQYQKFSLLSSYGLSRVDNPTISNIIAAPFYADSKVHTPLQLSDMVGYLVGRNSLAEIRGEPVKPPIIDDWLEKHYVPLFIKPESAVRGADFSETFSAILEEMWPVDFGDEYLNEVFAVLTKTLVGKLSTRSTAEDQKENGDETPEGLTPVT